MSPFSPHLYPPPQPSPPPTLGPTTLWVFSLLMMNFHDSILYFRQKFLPYIRLKVVTWWVLFNGSCSQSCMKWECHLSYTHVCFTLSFVISEWGTENQRQQDSCELDQLVMDWIELFFSQMSEYWWDICRLNYPLNISIINYKYMFHSSHWTLSYPKKTWIEWRKPLDIIKKQFLGQAGSADIAVAYQLPK